MPTGYVSLSMKPETADKFRRIAKAQRRNLLEALDLCADEILAAITPTPRQSKHRATHTPPGRSGTNGVSSEPLPVAPEQAGA